MSDEVSEVVNESDIVNGVDSGVQLDRERLAAATISGNELILSKGSSGGVSWWLISALRVLLVNRLEDDFVTLLENGLS